MAKQGVIKRAFMALLLLSLVLPMGASVWAGPIDEAGTPITITAVDTIAPSAVTNLTAETGPTPGTVVLSWKASGDDVTTGTATGYIVRYAATPVDEATWDHRRARAGERSPQRGFPDAATRLGLLLGCGDRSPASSGQSADGEMVG